jgi:MYXO-CTERM domain-containing protein
VSLRVRTAVAFGLASLFASSAHASDGFLPRTPVLWQEVPCLERVDRSVEPVMHLPYAIPHEDTDLTEDEVADSRTHQFFAFCRRKHEVEHLPNWITWDDVDAAVQAGSLESRDLVGDEDVLESNTKWAGCWSRITEDDARRPIEQSMADAGVDWDTAGLEPGGYTVYGYTYQPPLNPWFIRPGVVKIHDGDADAAGPAAATFERTEPDVVVYNGATVVIEGCVDSASPATVTGYYAFVVGGEPNWVPFVEGQAIAGNEFSVELFAAPDIAGKSSMIRIDIEDPANRKHTTFMDEVVIVLEGSDPNDCEDSGGFIGGPDCDDEPTSTGADTSGPSSAGDTDDVTGGSDTEGGPPQQGNTSGCSCSAPSGPSAFASLALLGLLGLRRRDRFAVRADAEA